ncbi:uncharacterized protein LOC127093827 [Lathyrus oleraceus]|uniref:uncharacterized protein LOC127093827 n=1 Tax=Pisum sativum TaxID=3888 RepID=UPI0021CFF366|nr:uncharacterized protein LOC127093827 [Pisum sativum]
MRRAIGRPKKLRNKANDEPKNPHVLSRRIATINCKKYGEMGHNKRSYKGKRDADRAIPRGGNKAKKAMTIKGGNKAKKAKNIKGGNKAKKVKKSSENQDEIGQCISDSSDNDLGYTSADLELLSLVINEDHEKKWSCDWKTRNTLISTLGVDEYYNVSHYKTVKAMCDSLVVTHEGTNEVKQARINTLNQEFELFHMKHGETIVDMKKRFTHLINRLNAIGKPVSNEISTNKILRCLNREWQPKVIATKEVNNLLTLDTTTLFGKLKEHKQELTCFEKHEKKIKKEKNKENERNGLKHSNKNLINYRRQANSLKQDENKKEKSKGLGFNCGKFDHYKPDCPLLKKDTGNGQYKKSTKPKRAYITWESDNESSSESDEAEIFCLMAHHHKKKNVSHYKYEPIDEMSYSELQIAFENLYDEVVDAFKSLASNKRIFSYLEVKVLETEKQMEALKQTKLDASKVDVEDEKPSWFGCETCHIWKKEVITLKAKLNQTLEQKVAFSINQTKFKRSLNVSYKKYNFAVRESNSESHSHHHLTCHYCCKKGHTISKCKFR